MAPWPLWFRHLCLKSEIVLSFAQTFPPNLSMCPMGCGRLPRDITHAEKLAQQPPWTEPWAATLIMSSKLKLVLGTMGFGRRRLTEDSAVRFDYSNVSLTCQLAHCVCSHTRSWTLSLLGDTRRLILRSCAWGWSLKWHNSRHNCLCVYDWLHPH